MNSTITKTFYTCSPESLFQESCGNRWFSSMFSTYISRTWWLLLKNSFKDFVKPYHEDFSSKAWSMWHHHISQNIFFWKLLLDLHLANSRILYFWQFLESIQQFIIEIHALQCLFVRGSNKQERSDRIIYSFTKGQTFSSLMTTKWPWG